MTGKYPQRVGITDYINAAGGNQPEKWNRDTKLLPAPYSDRLAVDEYTLAEAARDAGYATFFAGKWHLGPEGFYPEDQGFDINIGGCEWGHPPTYFSPYRNPRMSNGPAGETLPSRLASEAASFVEQNKQQPFLVYLSFYEVHTPLMTTDELKAKYKARADKLPKAEFGQEHERKVRLDQTHPVYAGMVEQMDSAVGQVLDALDSAGVADNTIVVFTSDNGGLSTSEGSPTSNVPLRAGKGWCYEGGVRVPYIVRWPGVTKAGSESREPVISMDLNATLRGAMGQPVTAGQTCDGQDLKPLLAGEGKPAERALYWDYPHYGNQGGYPYGAVRHGDWKLISWYEPGMSDELYNLADDLSETNNLASSQPERVAEMRAMLESWRTEVGAKAPTRNTRGGK
jgi:arylsulfatase A-like enzyme